MKNPFDDDIPAVGGNPFDDGAVALANPFDDDAPPAPVAFEDSPYQQAQARKKLGQPTRTGINPQENDDTLQAMGSTASVLGQTVRRGGVGTLNTLTESINTTADLGLKLGGAINGIPAESIPNVPDIPKMAMPEDDLTTGQRQMVDIPAGFAGQAPAFLLGGAIAAPLKAMQYAKYLAPAAEFMLGGAMASEHGQTAAGLMTNATMGVVSPIATKIAGAVPKGLMNDLAGRAAAGLGFAGTTAASEELQGHPFDLVNTAVAGGLGMAFHQDHVELGPDGKPKPAPVEPELTPEQAAAKRALEGPPDMPPEMEQPELGIQAPVTPVPQEGQLDVLNGNPLPTGGAAPRDPAPAVLAPQEGQLDALSVRPLPAGAVEKPAVKPPEIPVGVADAPPSPEVVATADVPPAAPEKVYNVSNDWLDLVEKSGGVPFVVPKRVQADAAKQYGLQYDPTKHTAEQFVQMLAEKRATAQAATEARPNLDLFGEAPEPLPDPVAAEATGPVAASKELPVEKYPIIETPLDQIKLSKDVPNFKDRANPKTGEVYGEELEGKYNRLGTPAIVLWERNNGDLEVITGRHRLGLARRSGEQTIPTQIVKESEGFTRDLAHRLDAESNIRDEKGTEKDYAQYIRGQGLSEAQAAEAGLVSRAKGKRGFSIGTHGSDNLYETFVNDGIDPLRAHAIADAVPGNAKAQDNALKYYLNDKSASPAKLADRAKFAAYLDSHGEGIQGDLLGDTGTGLDESFEIMSKYADEKRAAIDEDLRTIEGVAKRPDNARKFGIDPGDVDSLESKRKQLLKERSKYAGWMDDPVAREEIARETGARLPDDTPAVDVPDPEPEPDITGGFDFEEQAPEPAPKPVAGGVPKKKQSSRGAMDVRGKQSREGGYVQFPNGKAKVVLTPEEADIASRIHYGEQPKREGQFLNLWDRSIANVFNTGRAFDKVSAIAKKTAYPNLKPSADPGVLRRNIGGLTGIVNDVIQGAGVRDWKTGKVVSESLQSIVKAIPKGGEEKMRAYMLARAAVEAEKQPAGAVTTGINVRNAEKMLEMNAGSEYEKLFDRFKKYQDGVLQYAVDSGLLSTKEAAGMREAWKDYVPLKRLMDKEGEIPDDVYAASATGVGGVAKLYHKRIGSERKIMDPIQSMMGNTHAVISAAKKNEVMLALTDLVRHVPELEDVGKKWDPNHGANANATRLKRRGQIEHWVFDKDVLRAVRNLNDSGQNIFSKFFSIPANIQRAGTVLHPAFTLANAFRDSMSAAVVSRSGLMPFEGPYKAMISMVTKGGKSKLKGLHEDLSAFGGDQAIESNYLYDQKAAEMIMRAPTVESAGRQVLNMVKNAPSTAMKPLHMLAKESEMLTRTAEYRRAYDEGMKRWNSHKEASIYAAGEARNLLDFAQGGYWTKPFKGPAAFFGSRLQGLAREADALNVFKDPKQAATTALKGMLWLTIPTVGNFLRNQDDPDYLTSSQLRRDANWFIRTPEFLGGKAYWLPKPPGIIGYGFTVPVERAMMQLMKHDPKAWRQWTEGMKQEIPNMFPTGVRWMSEAGSNYSSFQGRPIVPERLQKRAPEDQYDKNTPMVFREIAGGIAKVKDALGTQDKLFLNLDSPMIEDYVWSSMFGSLGKTAVRGFSVGNIKIPLVNKLFPHPEGEPQPQEKSLLARFEDDPSQAGGEPVARFYELYNHLSQEKSKVERGKDTDAPINMLKQMDKAKHQISQISEAMQQTSDERELAELRSNIVAIASNFVDLPEGADQPRRVAGGVPK